MNNLLHSNRFKLNQHPRKVVDYDLALFLSGVFLTAVVPVAIYLAFRGPVPFMAFAVTDLAGIILGLAYYQYFPYQVISCVNTQVRTSATSTTGTTRPPTAGSNQKKAA